MLHQVLKSVAALALPLFICIGCGEQAQEAAENANRDTVPVIETQPSRDSVNADSVLAR